VGRCQEVKHLTFRHNVATLWSMGSKRTSTRATEKPTKTEIVRMRVSADEKRALEEAAARDGQTFSAWMRRLALREAGVLPKNRG